MVRNTATRASAKRPALAKKSNRIEAISHGNDDEIVATNSRELPKTAIGAAGELHQQATAQSGVLTSNQGLPI